MSDLATELECSCGQVCLGLVGWLVVFVWTKRLHVVRWLLRGEGDAKVTLSIYRGGVL